MQSPRSRTHKQDGEKDRSITILPQQPAATRVFSARGEKKQREEVETGRTRRRTLRLCCAVFNSRLALVAATCAACWALYFLLSSASPACYQLLYSAAGELRRPAAAHVRDSASSSSSLSAAHQRALQQLRECLQEHALLPSRADPRPVPHSPSSRPFPPVPSDCLTSLSLHNRTHERSLLEYALLISRLNASDEELQFFDVLGDRRGRGMTAVFDTPPSQLLQLADWDQGVQSARRAGAQCEHLLLSQGPYAKNASVYAVRDGRARVVSDGKDVDGNPAHRLFLSTAAPISPHDNIMRCTPTSAQKGQAVLDNVTITSAPLSAASACNASLHALSPAPPVTYLLSRHNSANVWHTLIEHIYPQWLQMFLRGDFPLSLSELSKLPSSHYELLVFHETGRPNGPVFDTLWQQLFNSPLGYLPAAPSASSPSLCCDLCILGPPKALALYYYWGGSRFTFDASSLVFVRLFRRFVYGRLAVHPWKTGQLLRYSFQAGAGADARQQQEDKQRPPPSLPPYVLPDFPALIRQEMRLQGASDAGHLNNQSWDWTRLMNENRTVLLSPSSFASSSVNLTAAAFTVSTLPLVVFIRRLPINNPAADAEHRTLSPISRLQSFYSQPEIADSLSYHLLLLYIEDLPLSDQLRLLSRASVLLTVEGAAEVNQLFLPLHSAVIEIACGERFFDGGRPRPWHQSLAQYLGHRFIAWPLERHRCGEIDELFLHKLHELLTSVVHPSSAHDSQYIYLS